MKLITLSLMLLTTVSVSAQKKVNPVIKDFGGIYDIPEATVKVDKEQPYNIVVDVYSAADNPEELNPALNNVARMLNLHSVAGADMHQVHVVLAVHAGATYALMDNASYRSKYGSDNANVALVSALVDHGVKVTVCGQSLISREVDPDSLITGVEVATSMLTTVSTYQGMGYTFLRF